MPLNKEATMIENQLKMLILKKLQNVQLMFVSQNSSSAK